MESLRHCIEVLIWHEQIGNIQDLFNISFYQNNLLFKTNNPVSSYFFSNKAIRIGKIRIGYQMVQCLKTTLTDSDTVHRKL